MISSTPAQMGTKKDHNLKFIVIGQIIKPHGIRGEVSVKVLTDFTERFDTMTSVYLGDNDSAELHEVKDVRWHKNHVLILFKDIEDRNMAETLRGIHLAVPIEEAMLLDPDTLYHHQLQGLTVITDTGETLGHISEILETGANDVYVVKNDSGEILIPATKEVINQVNLETGEMVVHLLPGLI